MTAQEQRGGGIHEMPPPLIFRMAILSMLAGAIFPELLAKPTMHKLFSKSLEIGSIRPCAHSLTASFFFDGLRGNILCECPKAMSEC
jgi:hypothetical protein